MAGMGDGEQAVLVYATFPGIEEAERIGRSLVEARLAACVNILPGMTSLYRWGDKIERGQEAAMIIKTVARLADEAIAFARARHSSANPAFVVLATEGGSADFLKWIREETVEASK